MCVCAGLREALLALASPSEQVEEGKDLMSLMRNRVNDDKAVVRKAALQVTSLARLHTHTHTLRGPPSSPQHTAPTLKWPLHVRCNHIAGTHTHAC